MHARHTIVSAGQAIRRGKLSPQALLAECLAAIDRCEPQVQAWVSVDRAGALAAAEVCAVELAAGRDRGPLHGIPIGIKDIVDVAGWPTRAASPTTSSEPAQRDAAVVAKLRAAGAIILGKTVTTELACFAPPPTRNPWNLDRTPGGSSSGSAVAVALGMCLGAIGSQTGGSITRPASYCGVCGCKPTLGAVSREGVLSVSDHLDHVGPMAGDVAGVAAMLSAISSLHVPPAIEPCAAPPRLGLLREFFWDRCEVAAREVIDSAVSTLAAAGAEIVDVPLPAGFGDVHRVHRAIMSVEAAAVHRVALARDRDQFSASMQQLLDEGLAHSADDYARALNSQQVFCASLAASFAAGRILLTPATTGAAPGRETTGDPSFNSPWSLAGVPTVNLPCGLAGGLPVGLQLIGPAGSEAALCQAALWCENQLGFCETPSVC